MTTEATSGFRQKMIFHIDMDQFFVAVEMHINPYLKGKAVIVGGNPSGRGIVTTASYEARKFGVHSGMSAGEAIKLCPHAIFVKPDSARYIHASKQVLGILCRFTPMVEPVSVDEAYLDVTDAVRLNGGVEALAMKIKQTIRDETGLSASVGAGANRLVAKVACGMHKPDGFTYLPPEKVKAAYRDMPVGDLCGVGRSTQRVLESFGIRTAGQLAEFPVDILKRRFGKFGEDLSRIANGEGNDVILPPDDQPDEKSMGHEHTFSHDLTDMHDLMARLELLSEKVARRLRVAGMVGRTVTIKIRYRGFETLLHGHKLARYIQHELDIFGVAQQLFRAKYDPARPVRLIGVSVSALRPADDIIQQELFVAAREADVLAAACDAVKERFGETAIGYASSFIQGEGRRGSPRRAGYFNAFFRPPLP